MKNHPWKRQENLTNAKYNQPQKSATVPGLVREEAMAVTVARKLSSHLKLEIHYTDKTRCFRRHLHLGLRVGTLFQLSSFWAGAGCSLG